MLTITKKNSTTQYTGAIVVTDEMASKVTQAFGSKFEAFCFGIGQGWSKKSIMKYCLDTTNNQYFYNYYVKYQASKSK